MMKNFFLSWILFTRCIRKASSMEMLRQQMIPVSMQHSSQHRAGVALQRQHGDQTMVLKTVQQFSTAILLYPIQLFVVLSMVSTQDVSIQIRHLSCWILLILILRYVTGSTTVQKALTSSTPRIIRYIAWAQIGRWLDIHRLVMLILISGMK